MCFRFGVILLLCLSIFNIVSSITSDELRITLPNGSKLLRKCLRSHNGRPIKAFTSVPYAKPPVGHLRFKAPEPIDKWHGEYKAVNDVPMCTQRNPFTRSEEDVGQEDCLYLNVYVPHTFEEKRGNLPVLVYIHGGGFMCGSSSKYSPDYFLDHDVILVTTNYRVGPIGFLSTEDENCPGNFGLKDQVMALKWIQQNINRFGGDPSSVTIFGGSAGGASVNYLMMSPLAKGLFAKAIAQSASNLAPWSQPAHKGVAIKRAKQLAEHFNCYMPNNWMKTINCMRDISATDITAAFYDFFEFDTDPMVIFTPVVEPDLPGAFITEHPRDGHSENTLKIPFMTGITFDEGLMKTSAPSVPIPYAASYGTYYPPHHPAAVEHRPPQQPPQHAPPTTVPSAVSPANSSFEQFDNAKNTPPHDRGTPNAYQSPPAEEPTASSSEFSGLVSYFSSQQDDLET